jgi:hypothetical protein
VFVALARHGAARALGVNHATVARFGPVSLERREFEIVPRCTRPQEGDVTAKLIGTVGMGFYGTVA